MTNLRQPASLRLRFLCTTGIGLLAAFALPMLADAQVTGPPTGGGSSSPSPSLTGPTTPQAFQTRDPLGVDLTTGDITYTKPLVSIGAPGTRTLTATYENYGGTDENTGAVDYSGDQFMGVYSYKLSLGDASEIFSDSAGSPVSTEGLGSTLTFDAASNSYIYTQRDGTVAVYSKALAGYLQIPSNRGVLVSVTYPTGEKLTYSYRTLTSPSGPYVRLRSVVSNRGLMLKYTGIADTPGGLTIAAVNLAVDYCDPLADSCAGTSQAWPSAYMANPTSTSSSSGSTSYYSLTRQVTDPAGKISKRIYNQTLISYGTTAQTKYNVQLVNEIGNVETVTYYDTWTNNPSPPLFNDGKVATAAVGSTVSRNYSFQGSGLSHPWLQSASSYSPGTNGDALTLTMQLNSSYVEQVAPKISTVLGNATTYKRDTSGRIIEIDRAEGDSDVYTYDGRGNITQVNHKVKPGFTDGDIITRATYPATCANPKTCNQPTATFDAKNNETDYTYDPVTGLLLTKTEPADSNGIRRVTTNTYTAMYAKVKNSGGAVVNADSPIYVLTKTSICATQASCAGTSDERVMTYSYNANLYPTAVTTSGNGLSVTTTTNYDRMGNVVSVDAPRTDVDDVSYKTYDVMRRPIFEITPDPDGAPGTTGYGPLLRRVVRHVYDDAGQEIRTEAGVGQAADGSDFVRKSYVAYTYNDSGLKMRMASYIDGNTTAQTVTDYAYDSSGRQTCTALRMNISAAGTSPIDACTLTTTGTYGPDRIAKQQYNAGSQLTEVDQAVGTSSQRAYARYSYSNNGLKTTETDANGNRSTYVYDGFDRLSQIQYPSTTIGSGTSNTADYQAWGRDVNGNKTWWRHRDGKYTYYNFDNLNREILHYPSDGSIPNIYSGYDLWGHILWRRFTSTSGAGTSYAYDGLGRLASTTDLFGRTLRYSYNQAGVKTQIRYPDMNAIGYQVDNLNRMIHFGWNASTGLFNQNYDNLGRMTGQDKSGGGTGYAFDNLDRLTTESINLAGTTYDVTWNFAYNPAGQVASSTASTTTYDYKETANSSDSPSYDGLNRDTRLTASNAYCSNQSLNGYDARQNLTCDSLTGRVYSYDIENRLLTASGTGTGGAVSMTYDPEGRLSSYAAGGVTTTFLYDGKNLVAEYNGSGTTMLRRYVHGPGADNPLVWLEGAGNASPKWYYTDYKGSIVAATDSAGNMTDFYKYGPYGEPKTLGNTDDWASGHSRFRYTGQIMLPEAHLYSYKARAYDPKWGRFLQVDPAGPKDDLNLYSYTRGDPINGVDPTGLDTKITVFYYIMGKAPIQGKFGHSYTVIEDTDTHSKSVTRAGPGGGDVGKDGTEKGYKGGILGAVLDSNSNHTVVLPEITSVENSTDTKAITANGYVEEEYFEITIPDDYIDVLDKVGEEASKIAGAQIPYKPRSDNSNRYTATIYKAITGLPFPPAKFLPGSEGNFDARDKKPHVTVEMEN